jgi:hypothetical protein
MNNLIIHMSSQQNPQANQGQARKISDSLTPETKKLLRECVNDEIQKGRFDKAREIATVYEL